MKIDTWLAIAQTLMGLITLWLMFEARNGAQSVESPEASNEKPTKKPKKRAERSLDRFLYIVTIVSAVILGCHFGVFAVMSAPPTRLEIVVLCADCVLFSLIWSGCSAILSSMLVTRGLLWFISARDAKKEISGFRQEQEALTSGQAQSPVAESTSKVKTPKI